MNEFKNVRYAIMDLDDTIIKHFNELEAKKVSELFELDDREQFVQEFSNFWECFAAITPDEKMSKKVLYDILASRITVIREGKISAEEFYKRFTKREPTISCYDGAKELLKYLNEKLDAVYVLSDWFEEDQMRGLRLFGLEKFFEKIYTWDDFYPKPNPKAIERIIGNGNKEEYVMIGNSVRADVGCANNAGIKSILVNHKGKNTDNVNATKVVNSLLEIMDIL